MTEEQLQAQCTQWFWNEYRFTTYRRMLHCNNNNSHNKIAGNIAKSLGVMPGVSDLEFVGDKCMWFIELKLPNGIQSDEQIEFQTQVQLRGHYYVIIRSLEDFKKLIWQIIGS